LYQFLRKDSQWLEEKEGCRSPLAMTNSDICHVMEDARLHEYQEHAHVSSSHRSAAYSQNIEHCICPTDQRRS
jgi:hypothetical protein